MTKNSKGDKGKNRAHSRSSSSPESRPIPVTPPSVRPTRKRKRETQERSPRTMAVAENLLNFSKIARKEISRSSQRAGPSSISLGPSLRSFLPGTPPSQRRAMTVSFRNIERKSEKDRKIIAEIEKINKSIRQKSNRINTFRTISEGAYRDYVLKFRGLSRDAQISVSRYMSGQPLESIPPGYRSAALSLKVLRETSLKKESDIAKDIRAIQRMHFKRQKLEAKLG